MSIFVKPLLAAILLSVGGVDCRSDRPRRGVSTRCRDRRELGDNFYDLRDVVFDLPGYDEWKHGDLSFGFNVQELCTHEPAIATCYYFLNNPVACNNPGYCFDLCGGCDDRDDNLCDGDVCPDPNSRNRCGGVCSDYLNNCLREPCFGMGCGYTPYSVDLPQYRDDPACKAIVDCFKSSTVEEEEQCEVDICAVYPDSDVCTYMTLMNISAFDPYYIPCTCNLDLPVGDQGFSPAADILYWPGRYPSNPEVGQMVTLNIRTDNFAEETSWLVRKYNLELPGCDPESNPSECWEFATGGTFGQQASAGLSSYDIDIEEDTLYEIMFLDSFGDGFYSEAFGQGWFTVLEGPMQTDFSGCNDPNSFSRCGIVMSNFSEFEYDLRVYIAYNSTLKHTVYLLDFDPTTDSLGQAKRESCEDPGCYVPSEGDGSYYPGFFPEDFEPDYVDPAKYYFILNMRTDEYPEEAYIYQYAWRGPGMDDFQLIGYLEAGSVRNDQGLTLLTFIVEILERDLNTIHKFEFGDTWGDGSCCSYGYGWYTVNGRNGNTVFTVVGDELSYTTTRYMWVEGNGDLYLAEPAPGGYGISPYCSYYYFLPVEDADKAARVATNYDSKPPRNVSPNNAPIVVQGLSGYVGRTRKHSRRHPSQG